MPTKNEVIEKCGKEMWDKMCATGWLDAITLTIKSAVGVIRCTECGRIHPHLVLIKPFSWDTTQHMCPTEKRVTKHDVIDIITTETNIPMDDIQRAYRAANGEEIGWWEWD